MVIVQRQDARTHDLRDLHALNKSRARSQSRVWRVGGRLVPTPFDFDRGKRRRRDNHLWGGLDDQARPNALLPFTNSK